MSDDNCIIAFHGTSKMAKKMILSTKLFQSSDEDSEWAGAGVYFFSEKDEEKSKENAIKWARNIKKFKQNSDSLSVMLKIPENQVFDLTGTNSEDRELFEIYREKLFERAIEVARRNNAYIDEKYFNSAKFDCLTINDICKFINYAAVMRTVYINFNKYKYKYKNYKLVKSNIPNSTILCLRNQSFIKEWRP